jgi:hypothetical protein
MKEAFLSKNEKSLMCLMQEINIELRIGIGRCCSIAENMEHAPQVVTECICVRKAIQTIEFVFFFSCHVCFRYRERSLTPDLFDDEPMEEAFSSVKEAVQVHDVEHSVQV